MTKSLLILAYVFAHQQVAGYTPSLREISKACNIRAISQVHAFLEYLEGEGLMYRPLPRASRSLVITDKGKRSLKEMAPVMVRSMTVVTSSEGELVVQWNHENDQPRQ